MTTTGWHRHGEPYNECVTRDDQCCTTVEKARPVFVVDPATARETIARALCDAERGVGVWEPWATEEVRNEYRALADAVLAALAAGPGDET